MPFSKKQQEFFENANHRWNIKSGATRSGKTYMDYYVIPKRIRARAGKEGLTAILGVSDREIARNKRSCLGCPAQGGCQYRKAGGHCGLL